MGIKENQILEWKESWRDEYIKWICGFANAQGGTLFIGKNDKGIVTGVPAASELMEKIPNKVRDLLGIIIDVNLVKEKNKHFLEIVVEPYPYPVSYKGQYHYRSGSTKQELKGPALDKFLLKKQGKRWDGVPVPNVTVKHLENRALDLFRAKAAESRRLSKEVLSENNKILIENLRIKDGKYLKRAAVLLFHPDPESFFTGAYIKIGFFQTDADLIYQDEIHGNLFEQSEKAMDLLLTKYLKAYISYEGITRVERFLFPHEAIREALLNAIVHKDYGSGVPIQIKVYDNKIIFWNEGELPEHWTIERLKQQHPSSPYNPDIANAFFRAGLIESWGRGIEKIKFECHNHGIPIPEYKYVPSNFMLEIDATGMLNKIRKQNLFDDKVNGLEDKYCRKKTPKRLNKDGKLGENQAEKLGGNLTEKLGENRAEKLGRNLNDEFGQKEKAGGKIAVKSGDKQVQKLSKNERFGEKLGEKFGEKLGGNLTEKLGENRANILLIMSKFPAITIPELSKLIGISATAIEKNIQYLKEHVYIKRIGPAKGGSWKIIEK